MLKFWFKLEHFLFDFSETMSYHVDQIGLEPIMQSKLTLTHKDPPASASWGLELLVCTTMSGFWTYLKSFNCILFS